MDIGPTLREARLRAKVDISEVEAHTKIRAKYLRALENEEWELLPGPTFVKTFLRTYAEYLGLDSRLLVNAWKQQYEHPSEEGGPISPPAARRGADRGGPGGSRGPRIPRAAIVVVALLGVVAALAVLGSIGQDDGESNGSNVDTAEQAREERAAERRERRRRWRQRAARREAAKRRNQPVRLQLVPTGEVWVCLQNANGDRLIPGEILSPGGEQPTFRSRKFTMTFGNGEIDLRINGKLSEVPPSSEPVGYFVDRNGRKPLPEDERPTCGA
jgi:cytoskeleton protein RodZ